MLGISTGSKEMDQATYRASHSMVALDQHNDAEHQNALSQLSTIPSAPANPPPAPGSLTPQVYSNISGVCVRYDDASGQGRAVCALPKLPSGGAVEVAFATQSYVAAAGDPPTPYLGQPLLMEIVVFHPASGTYWSGSVRDQRGVAFNFLNPHTQLQTQAGNLFDPLEDVAQQMGGLRVTPTDPPMSNTGPSADDYEVIITLLRRSSGHNYMGDALSLLRRSRPQSAESIRDLDPEMKRAMLISFLSNEMKAARGEQPDGNLSRDDGFESRPLVPPPPPLPTTFYCSICQEDDPMEEMFIVRGCDHQFCRESIELHISQCLQQKNVRPRCPECTATISDADISMVLTQDQMLHYYNLSVMAGSDDAPDTHKCAAEGCHGVAWLDRDDTHFRCPIPSCQAERCVTCNTREWHEGQTCEQVRQQRQNNDLQPEQLRQLYQGTAYMCGRCSYGPILHGFCANLQTHQGQVQGGATIRNNCPQCEWFSTDISHWPKWDGQTWEERNAAVGN